MNNRLHNLSNPAQGSRKKVLCVCSAGLLRSPTAAWILSNEPFGFNTRAVGTSSDHALIPLDWAHIVWADYIVVMDKYQRIDVLRKYREFQEGNTQYIKEPNIFILDTPDTYEFRDPRLVDLMTLKLMNVFKISGV